MEIPDIEPEENQEDAVEIYSKWAIWGFSILSPIFGGILLFINLKKAGFTRAAFTVLAFAIGYLFLEGIIFNGMNLGSGLTPLLINFLGGLMLTELFYKKYFPDDDYYPRPIWGALAVIIIIYIGMFYTLYHAGKLPPEIMKMLSKK